MQTTNTANLLFKTKLSNLKNSIAYYKEQGYTPLITRAYVRLSSSDDKLIPLNEYENEKEMPLGERVSVRLFMKDKKIYSANYNSLLTKSEPPPLKLLEDKQGIYLIVVKNIVNDQHFYELVYELRVSSGIKSGHPNLIKNNQHDAIVAAGEYYPKDAKLLFVDNQTGHFYKRLEHYQLEAQQIFEMFFPPELGYHYYQLPSLEDITLKPNEDPNAKYKGLVSKIKPGQDPDATYKELIEKELDLLGWTSSSNVTPHVTPNMPSLESITDSFTVFSVSNKAKNVQTQPALDQSNVNANLTNPDINTNTNTSKSEDSKNLSLITNNN